MDTEFKPSMKACKIHVTVHGSLDVKVVYKAIIVIMGSSKV